MPGGECSDLLGMETGAASYRQVTSRNLCMRWPRSSAARRPKAARCPQGTDQAGDAPGGWPSAGEGPSVNRAESEERPALTGAPTPHDCPATPQPAAPIENIPQLRPRDRAAEAEGKGHNPSPARNGRTAGDTLGEPAAHKAAGGPQAPGPLLQGPRFIK